MLRLLPHLRRWGSERVAQPWLGLYLTALRARMGPERKVDHKRASVLSLVLLRVRVGCSQALSAALNQNKKLFLTLCLTLHSPVPSLTPDWGPERSKSSQAWIRPCVDTLLTVPSRCHQVKAEYRKKSQSPRKVIDPAQCASQGSELSPGGSGRAEDDEAQVLAALVLSAHNPHPHLPSLHTPLGDPPLPQQSWKSFQPTLVMRKVELRAVNNLSR